VTGYAGLISLGQAAFMAVGAFIGLIAYGRHDVAPPGESPARRLAAALVGAVVDPVPSDPRL